MKKKIIIASVLLASLNSLQSAWYSNASRFGAFARFIPAVLQQRPEVVQTPPANPPLIEPSQPQIRQIQLPTPSSHTIERSTPPARATNTRTHTAPATTVHTNTLTGPAIQSPTNQPPTQAIYDFTSLAQQLAALSARSSATPEVTNAQAHQTNHTTYQSRSTVGLGRQRTIDPTALITATATRNEQQTHVYRNPQPLALLPATQPTQAQITVLTATPDLPLAQTTQEHFVLPQEATQQTPNFNACLEVIEGLNALAQAYGFDGSTPLTITAQSVAPHDVARETQRNKLTFEQLPALTDGSNPAQPGTLSLIPAQEGAIIPAHRTSEQITDMVKITMASAAGTAATFFVARKNLASKEALLRTLETLTLSLRQATHNTQPATQATLPALRGAQSQPTFASIAQPALPAPTAPRIHVELAPTSPQPTLPARPTPPAGLTTPTQPAHIPTPRPTSPAPTATPRIHVELAPTSPQPTLPTRPTPAVRQPVRPVATTPTPSSVPAQPTPAPRIRPQATLTTQSMPLVTRPRPIPAPRKPITTPAITKPVPKPRIPQPATLNTPNLLPTTPPPVTPVKQKQTSNTQTNPDPAIDTAKPTDTPVDPALSEKTPTKQVEKAQDGEKHAPTKKIMRTPEQSTQKAPNTTEPAQEKPVMPSKAAPENHSTKKQTPYELPLLTNKGTQLVVAQGKDAARTPSSVTPAKDAPAAKVTPSSKTILSGFDKAHTSQINPAPRVILTELPTITPTTYTPRETHSRIIKTDQTPAAPTKTLNQASSTPTITQAATITTSSLVSSVIQVVIETVKTCTPLLMTLVQPLFNTLRTLIINL